jgi:hypothetical protein
MQDKSLHFHAFEVNRRNFSVYVCYFLYNLHIKRNFSAYFSDWLLKLVPQTIRTDPHDPGCGDQHLFID